MGKFIVLSFVLLGLGFYELSGGAEFEPQVRGPAVIAATELAPATQPEVTRAANASSLIQIPAPAAEETATVQQASFNAPLPAGQVLITPAPEAVVEVASAAAADEIGIVEVAAVDLRAVAGEWVNMRSGPSTNYDVLETLPRGTAAEVMEVDATGWARIRVTDTGQIGWMAERLLTDS